MSTFFNITLSCETKRNETQRRSHSYMSIVPLLYQEYLFDEPNIFHSQRNKTNILSQHKRAFFFKKKGDEELGTYDSHFFAFIQTGSIFSIRTTILVGTPVFFMHPTISPSFNCTTGMLRTLELPLLSSMIKLRSNEIH